MHTSSDKHGEIPELLTIRKLATILKISQRSIWRLVASGQLVEPLRHCMKMRLRAVHRLWRPRPQSLFYCNREKLSILIVIIGCRRLSNSRRHT